MKVLVVDDDLVTSALVSEDLQQLGYEVALAESGEEGWQAFQRGGFSIVILDWEMPGMSGPDLCRLIRGVSDRGYTYLILLTGRSKREDRFDALSAGADDFLTKPVDSAELHARLAVASRILRSEEALHRLNSELQEARRQEGALASTIQRELLLGSPPPDHQHLRIACMCEPSSMVAGDFYDFYRHSGGVTDIVTGDVMGKGVPAALVAAGVKSSLEKGLLTTMGTQTELPRLEHVLGELCTEVVPRLAELSTFSTLTYARFDEGKGTLTYANCGNPEILRWSSMTNECDLLPTTTAPIGFLAEDDFTPSAVHLSPGDLLLFYSDGITDMVMAGERFGSDRLREWLQERGHMPLPSLIDDLDELRKAGHATDDFTCVAVRFIGSPDVDAENRWMELEDLAALRENVYSRAIEAGLPQEAVDELVLAIHELATNAIAHGRKGHSGIPLETRIEATEKGITAQLSYPGMGFNPFEQPMEAPSVENTGGFGLSIVHHCIDRLEYRFEGNRNHIVLFKDSISRHEH